MQQPSGRRIYMSNVLTQDNFQPHSPSFLLQIMELRALSEVMIGLVSWPLLKKCVRGDGHAT